MEIIRKKICLESSRTRKQGILPYIPFNVDVSEEANPFVYVTDDDNNGNWGGFVANPATTALDGMFEFENYLELSAKYNKIQDILNKSKHAKYVSNNANGQYMEYTNGNVDFYDYVAFDKKQLSVRGEHRFVVSPFYNGTKPNFIYIIDDFDEFLKLDNISFDFCKNFENYIGLIRIPTNIEGDLVPDTLNMCDIFSYLEWLQTNENTKDCCVHKLWERKGGRPLIDYFESILPSVRAKISTAKTYLPLKDGSAYKESIPVIKVPILLTQNTSSDGMYCPYLEYGVDYTYSGDGKTYSREVSGFTVESKLKSLRYWPIKYDDNGNELPGVFKTFRSEENGVIYTSALYYFNENEGEEGEWVKSSANEYPDDYIVVDIAAEIPSDADRTSCYLVRYDNSVDSPMDIPYREFMPKNISSVKDINGNAVTDEEGRYRMCGDFIISIDKESVEETIIFKYVFGGEYWAVPNGTRGNIVYDFDEYISGTGIVYKDTYEYGGIASDLFTIGGVESELFYEDINYSSAEETFTHPDFGLTRTGIKSEIIEMNFMESENKCSIKTPLFKPEYLIGVTDEIQSTVTLEISRGGASAFEQHFKLCECCSLEDLENYGNNYFNL